MKAQIFSINPRQDPFSAKGSVSYEAEGSMCYSNHLFLSFQNGNKSSILIWVVSLTERIGREILKTIRINSMNFKKPFCLPGSRPQGADPSKKASTICIYCLSHSRLGTLRWVIYPGVWRYIHSLAPFDVYATKPLPVSLPSSSVGVCVCKWVSSNISFAQQILVSFIQDDSTASQACH